MKPLTKTEIDFLASQSDSALQSILNTYSKADQSTILRQLIASQGPEAIDAHREANLRWAKKQSRRAQDIGQLPPEPTGQALELRQRCDESLKDHLLICYPNAFSLKFSSDHLRLIKDIEIAIRIGQLKAIAMPRGSGKTTIILRAAFWALITSLRKFAVLLTATEAAGINLLNSMKMEILTNGILASLYPRELHALRSLEGESRLASGQRYEGYRTNVGWMQNQINFGYIPGVESSGAILSSCGLTGNVRGQQYTAADGTIYRPDLVLLDDPQTKESAASPAQSQKRYEIMMGDVLGLAGPQTSIAALGAMTIIYQDDLADRILDRKQSPVWQGDLCSMVYRWSNNENLWDHYRTIWEQEKQEGADNAKSTRFLKDNFEAMHEGSKVAWPERFNANEISALQHAYHLRFRDETTFFAEYQNKPQTSAIEIPFDLRPDEIVQRTNNVPRGEVPAECEKITTFIDVQNDILFYLQMAWSMEGRGHVIEYGTFPDQRRLYFTKAEVRTGLSKLYRSDSLNECIYEGLTELTRQIFGVPESPRKYRRADGSEMTVDRCGIDARSGLHTRVVRRFCRESVYMGRVHPQFGLYLGKDSRPWHQFSHNDKHRLGVHCRMQPPPPQFPGVRELWVDTNFWKSFAAERLTCRLGADQAILLFQASPAIHKMLADHCAAEEPHLETGKIGNQVVEWKVRPGNANNDYWDCIVGNCVLASLEGVKVDIPDDQQVPTRKKPSRKAKKKQFVSLEG